MLMYRVPPFGVGWLGASIYAFLLEFLGFVMPLPWLFGWKFPFRARKKILGQLPSFSQKILEQFVLLVVSSIFIGLKDYFRLYLNVNFHCYILFIIWSSAAFFWNMNSYYPLRE